MDDESRLGHDTRKVSLSPEDDARIAAELTLDDLGARGDALGGW
jgi:hypothetical protein